jgi:hypothetical protein
VPESTDTDTELIPNFEEAVPETLMVPKTVEPAVGDWIVTRTLVAASTGPATTVRANTTARGAKIQRGLRSIAKPLKQLLSAAKA